MVVGGTYEHLGADILSMVKEEAIGYEGMKIDRMFFEKFEDVIRANDTVASAVEAGQWDRVIDYVNREIFDKPEESYTLDKLRKAAAVDRRLTLREILEKVFGLIPRFKSKDELLEEEFSKFVSDTKPEEAASATSSKASSSPSWLPTRCSPRLTSAPSRRSTVCSSLNTSRTTSP